VTQSKVSVVFLVDVGTKMTEVPSMTLMVADDACGKWHTACSRQMAYTMSVGQPQAVRMSKGLQEPQL